MPQPTDAPPPAPDARPGNYDDLAPARQAGVRLPAWVAVLVVALFAAGAVYAGWLMLRPAPKVDLSQYESNDARGRGVPRVEFTEGVVINPDGTGTAQTAAYGIRFLAGAKPSLTAFSRAAAPISERPFIRARKQILDDAAARQAAGVTADQLAKLRATALVQPPAVDAPTRVKLIELWAKLRTADAAARPAAEKAVMDVVKDAGARHAAASDAAYQKYGEKIRAVLKPEQLEKLKDRR